MPDKEKNDKLVQYSQHPTCTADEMARGIEEILKTYTPSEKTVHRMLKNAQPVAVPIVLRNLPTFAQAACQIAIEKGQVEVVKTIMRHLHHSRKYDLPEIHINLASLLITAIERKNHDLVQFLVLFMEQNSQTIPMEVWHKLKDSRYLMLSFNPQPEPELEESSSEVTPPEVI
jgi:F0F1-type ATP synthase delta subunit